MEAKIIRVFPTKTNATPDDELVRIREVPSLFDEADEVHISVAFTWDIPWAEWAARQWERVAPVKIGGPAYNEPGGEFVPGMYMKKGYVITSRGHIDEVFTMLARQPHRPQFVGGLEAALMTPAMAERLHELHPDSLFFAYDTPSDLEPLKAAGKMLLDAGLTKVGNRLRCYVLIGYKGDTFEKAQKRMGEAWRAGFMPFAMLYRDREGKFDKTWRRFQGQWANPTITYCNCKKYFGK